MAAVNEHIIYQPDDRPSHPISLVHGFQDVMTRMAAMAAIVSITAVAGGQPDGYLHWIFFTILLICGVGQMLQTFQFWRFGSGYPSASFLPRPLSASAFRRCPPAGR